MAQRSGPNKSKGGEAVSSTFEEFVQKIAAVPKAEADKIEAERPKTKKRWRKRPVKG